MYQLLFKNKFNALVFVAILLFSVRILVGTEEDKGTIVQAAENFGGQPAQARTYTSDPGRSAPATSVGAASGPSDTTSGFMSDDELIESTEGFDPVGIDPVPAITDPAADS